MSSPPKTDATHSPVIEDERQLVDYLASGAKPRDAFGFGTEHEKFLFRTRDLKPVPYDGPQGIGALLEGLAKRYDWTPHLEDGKLIALSRDGCTVTLEPGGQLELSGRILTSLHQTCDEVHTHLAEVRSVAEGMGIGCLGLGFHPLARREDIPWMPKARYRIMREYMPRVGRLGLDMMLRTCTVQVNLDFADEQDMATKFRVALALQPLATALFANSPFVEARPSGYLSYRAQVWTDTDPQRTGLLDFVFEPGFGFERYVQWMLDVPMYFVRRQGRYIDAAGQSFRDFLAGRLPALPGERPTLADWEDHLTTAFPDVRLKRYLEMRGADGGPWRRLCALPAFWVGLLYDPDNLAELDALIRQWSLPELLELRAQVPREALHAKFRGRPLHALALELLTMARAGLARRKRLNDSGDDETGFLQSLVATAERGQTEAERLLERYHGPWGQRIEPLFEEMAYY